MSINTEHQVIELLRNLAGLSDRELGDRAGLARDKVERLRAGRTKLTIGDARRLAAALNLPPSIFFEQPNEAAQTAIRSGILGTTDQGQPGSRCNPVPSWWDDLPAAA